MPYRRIVGAGAGAVDVAAQDIAAVIGFNHRCVAKTIDPVIAI